MTEYDVIVIGAGHNGLVCAQRLASADRRVVVLDARSEPGGCASSDEFHPGFKIPGCAQWLYQFSPKLEKELQLEKFGLSFSARKLGSIALSRDGEHLRLGRAGPQGVSAQDREAWADYDRLTRRYTRLLLSVFRRRAPKLVESNLQDRFNLARVGLGLKLLGKEDMSELLRTLLMNVYDVLNERFEDERLKGLLALDAVMGVHAGPRSPNSFFTYLYRHLGDGEGGFGVNQVRGGPGSLGLALAASAQAAGAQLRLETPVAAIELEQGRAVGVRLADGEQVRAPLVVSSADPKTTFENLVGQRQLETSVVRRVANVRSRGSVGKLHLALSGAPVFTGVAAGEMDQRLVIAPDMRTIERAFAAAKYGTLPEQVVMDISLPSVADASLAPAGKHVLSALVQYVPHTLSEGDWASQREAFVARLLDQLEQYAPGLSVLVEKAEFLTPADLEARYGMRGGNWHHAELSVDQVMMMRPFVGATQYDSPVPGLFLCGAGSHPGGGVNGLPGDNAAREILGREIPR